MTKQLSIPDGKPGSTLSQQQIVTIQIVNCKDLKVVYGDSNKVAPFFSYTFYTFETRYSMTSAGLNPNF